MQTQSNFKAQDFIELENR